MAFFLYGWDRNWREYEADGLEGQPLDHAASNNFGQKHVAPGDVVYVAIQRDGQMILVGRLPVSAVVDKREAETRLGRRLFNRRDHVLADTPNSTISFVRVVPEEIARSIRSERNASLPFVSDDEYRLKNQALRPMYRLTPDSAAALD